MAFSARGPGWHERRGARFSSLGGHLDWYCRCYPSTRRRDDTAGRIAIPTSAIEGETARFLHAHPGHAFCDECLAHRLGMTLRQIRHARIALAGSTEFDQEVWFCSACLAHKHVIHVAWLRFDVPPVDEEASSESYE